MKNKDTSGLQEVLSQASGLGLDQVILSSFECYSIRLAIDYADHEAISLILDKVDSPSRRQMMESGILYSLVLDESSNNFATLDFLLEKANNYYRDDQHFLIQAIKATIYSHEKPYEGRRWNGRSAFNFLIEKTTSDLRKVIFQSIPDSYRGALQLLSNQDTPPERQDTPPERQDTPPERQDTPPERQDTPPERQDIRLDTEHILEGQVVDLLKNMEKVQDEAIKYWKDKKGQRESQVIAYLRTTQLSEISLSYTLKTSSYRKINLLNKQIVLQILLWSVLKNKDTSGLQEVLSQASGLGLDQVILSSFECYSIRLAIDYADHEAISLILDKVDSPSRRQMMESGILYSLVLDESSNNFATLDFLLEKANNYYRDDQHFLIQAIKATIYSHEKPYEGRRWNGRSAFNFLIEKTTSDLRKVIFQSIPDSYQSVLQCLYNPNIRPGPEHTPEEPNIRPGPEHTPEEPNIRPGPEHTPEGPDVDRGLLAKHFPDEQKDEQKFKKLLYVMRPSDPSSLLHQPLAQRRIGRESNILEK